MSWRRPGCPPSPIWRSRTRGASLADYQRYSLVVHTSDLSRRALVRLPWDYPQYGRAADAERVVDAVRASMSIPFYFRPVDVQTAMGR